jgi:hypothetical protein
MFAGGSLHDPARSRARSRLTPRTPIRASLKELRRRPVAARGGWVVVVGADRGSCVVDEAHDAEHGPADASFFAVPVHLGFDELDGAESFCEAVKERLTAPPQAAPLVLVVSVSFDISRECGVAVSIV